MVQNALPYYPNVYHHQNNRDSNKREDVHHPLPVSILQQLHTGNQ